MGIFGKTTKTTTHDRGNRVETRTIVDGTVKRIVDTNKKTGAHTERTVARNVFGPYAGKPKK